MYLEGEGDIGALKTTCETAMLQEFVESLIVPVYFLKRETTEDSLTRSHF